MIIGSDFLLHIGATIDYGMCEIRSRRFGEMTAVPFDLKGAHQWRRATSVVALYDIILRPNRVEVVVGGGITAAEMRTLTHGKTDDGGIVPVRSIGNKGVEVKHTLQQIQTHRVGGRTVGRINVMLQNRNDCIITIKRGDEIGGFRTLLATALGIEGAGFISEMEAWSKRAEDPKNERAEDPKNEQAEESKCERVTDPNKSLWPEKGNYCEPAIHTTHTTDESVRRGESVRREQCEVSSDIHQPATLSKTQWNTNALTEKHPSVNTKCSKITARDGRPCESGATTPSVAETGRSCEPCGAISSMSSGESHRPRTQERRHRAEP
jgi:hypothetical protein